MGIKTDLALALQKALRAGDERRKRVIRMALSAVKLAELEKRAQLDDPEVMTILRKEIKSRRELIEDARQAGREEMIQDADAEIGILQEFLPGTLPPEELERLARGAIADVGAASPGDLGKVMKALMPRVQGRAEGSEVSRVVRALLQGD